MFYEGPLSQVTVVFRYLSVTLLNLNEINTHAPDLDGWRDCLSACDNHSGKRYAIYRELPHKEVFAKNSEWGEL